MAEDGAVEQGTGGGWSCTRDPTAAAHSRGCRRGACWDGRDTFPQRERDEGLILLFPAGSGQDKEPLIPGVGAVLHTDPGSRTAESHSR